SSLFTYPALMAADILLYDTNIVPVGEDQTQHLEFTRNLAERFNTQFGETFVVPDIKTPKVGARIMSLQEPTKKMSKSDENTKSYISRMDNQKKIENRLKSAVSDSESVVAFDKTKKPGVSNLLTIYAACHNQTVEEAATYFKDARYGDFKGAVAEAVVNKLAPIQEKYESLIHSEELDDILDQGAQKANQKMGLIRRESHM